MQTNEADAEVQDKEDTARTVRLPTVPSSSANEGDAEIQDKLSEFTNLVQTKLAAAKVEKDKSFSTIRGLKNRIDALKRESEEVEFHYELQLLQAKEEREDMKRLQLLEAEEKEEKIDSLTRRLAVSEKMKNEAQKQAKTELRVAAIVEKVLENERDDAVGRLDTAHGRIAALERQLDDAKRERDEAKVQMDEVIKKVECFSCHEHENPLCAFFPCGHLVCTDCKDKYAVDSPCPKCESNIMGRLRLYN
jgi:chromosome segregation ATPase